MRIVVSYHLLLLTQTGLTTDKGEHMPRQVGIFADLSKELNPISLNAWPQASEILNGKGRMEYDFRVGPLYGAVLIFHWNLQSNCYL